MRSRARVAGVVVALAVAARVGAAEVSAPARFSLDEYVVTVARTSNAFQLAAGLELGNSFGKGFWWFGGGRLSWVQAERAGDLANSTAVGVVSGFGYHPERTISPIARIGYDKWLGSGDAFRSQTCLSVGARLRFPERLDRHFAFSLEVYRSSLSGASGVPDQAETGFLLGYSLAFFRNR